MLCFYFLRKTFWEYKKWITLHVCFTELLKKKNDVKATAKKERNLHSPPRQNDQVESEIFDDKIKSYLKYREKFENLHLLK